MDIDFRNEKDFYLEEETIRVTVDLSAVIDSAHFAIDEFIIEQEEKENKTDRNDADPHPG